MFNKLPFNTSRGGTFAFGLCIVVLLWFSVAYKYEIDMVAARTDAERENTNLSLLFEENAIRSIEEIDKSLLYLRRFIETNPGREALSSIISASDLVSDIIVQVAVIDADGIMIASNASDQPLGRINLSDRPHFLFHKNNKADDLYISQPVVGRASGKWSVQFTRRLQTPAGAFAGVVVASLDPQHLTSFYDSMNYGSSTSVALIGDDGIVRSSGGNDKSLALGGNISTFDLFIRAKADGGATFSHIDPATHQRMLTTFRPLRGRSMWLTISRNMEADFGKPVQSLERNALIASLVSMLIIYVTIGIFLAEQRVRNKARQLRSTLDNMTEGIMLIAPDDVVQVINETCCRLLGFPADLVETPALVGGRVVEDIVGAARTGSDPLAADDGRSLFAREMPDGTVLEMRSNVLADRGIVCTVTDITDRRQAEDRIMQLASEDALTGLPNRRTFLAALKKLLEPVGAVSQTERAAEFAVLFLDVDHFKNINDSLGHRIGDLLLVDIGKRMRTLLPEKALVARLGGDEFALLLPSIASTSEVEAFAALINRSFEGPFDADGYQISTSVSIGISVGPRDASDVDALLAAADLALYSSKSERRGTYRFYSPTMTQGLEERRWIESALASSIAAEELEMHYQPIIDLKSGTLTGFEALARWHHPERGMIPPDKFIPVAEESGLISKFGAWALETACRRAAIWPAGLKVAVNVSPVQLLAPDMVAVVRRVLAETGLDPARLELEVTERILIQESDQTRNLLTELKQIGVRIVLDDFGTGYSSLSYLRTFTFDKVKIDRSFISDLTLGTDRTVIIQAVVSIARALGMQTTAEGVEVDYQRELLQALGCDQAQGYLFAKALTGAALESFIDRWTPGDAVRALDIAQAAAGRLRVS